MNLKEEEKIIVNGNDILAFDETTKWYVEVTFCPFDALFGSLDATGTSR